MRVRRDRVEDTLSGDFIFGWFDALVAGFV